MPARLAFPFIYRRLTRGMDEDQLLNVDAALGDVDAVAQVAKRDREIIEAAGGRIH